MNYRELYLRVHRSINPVKGFISQLPQESYVGKAKELVKEILQYQYPDVQTIGDVVDDIKVTRLDGIIFSSNFLFLLMNLDIDENFE